MAINNISYDTIFLTEADLKDASLINDNIDAKILTPIIRMVQEIFLTKIIGTGLYVDLQDKVYNTVNNLSGSTLSETDKFLLNAYIIPLLVWLVMAEAPVFITMKFMNKGVQVQNSDNSNAATDQQLQLLTNRAKRNSDWYSQRLINYLQANTALYPAYMQTKTIDDVVPTSKGYKTSVFLGGESYGNRNRGAWDCDDCSWHRFFA